MADKRISQLIERTDILNNDVLPIVASGATTTNKVTISTIQNWMQDNLDVGVTSVGITLGTSGTDVNVTGSPITTSGNITINIPTASATNRGLLSAADWSTFNAKQPAGNYVTLDTTQTITAHKTFTASGGQPSITINHSSGAGHALDITKAGNGEGIRVNKTSGSGNAMSVVGTLEATTLVRTGGTSSQFLKADGSVDSNTYLTSASASAAYVPYTGANSNVNLGQFHLDADTIRVNGSSPTSGSYLGFKHATNVTTGADGYTSMYTFGTNTIAFKSVSGATTKDFSFSMVNITAGVPGGRQYTLPDASGTIALTSDLGAYLPLSGGTMTGAINGISANFTSNLSSDSGVYSNTAFFAKHNPGSTVTVNGWNAMQGDANTFIVLNSTKGMRINFPSNASFTHTLPDASGTIALTSNLSSYLPLSGGTLTGALNGTSASFSGELTIGNGTDSIIRANSSVVGSFQSTLIQASTANVSTILDIRPSGNSTSMAGIFLRDSATAPINTNTMIFGRGNVTLPSTGVSYIGNIVSNAQNANSLHLGFLVSNTSAGRIEVARIFNSGNIVLQNGGTFTDAGFRLDVNGTARVQGAATFSSSVTTGAAINLPNNFSLTGRNAANTLNISLISRNTSDRVVIDPDGYGTNIGGGGTVLINPTGGNVGIGTTSPGSYRLNVQTSGAAGIQLNGTGTGGCWMAWSNSGTDNGYIASAYHLFSGSSVNDFGVRAENNLIFGISSNERMRITSGGFLKASNTGSYWSATGSYHELVSNSGGNWIAIMPHSASNPFGIYMPYTGGSPNNEGNEYLYFTDSSTVRFAVRSNGGVVNFQANNINLSDERTKKDIEPLESYWDKFKEIEIVKFKYKDQTHDDFNIGVIAQQVEAVAPEFVDVDGWDTRPKLDEEGNEIVSEEEPLKSIYTADLYHASIKVLQEAMTKIEKLEAEIEALKSQING